MAGLGDLFGKNSIFEQLFVWGVLNQVIGALGSPYFETLTQNVNAAHPVAELSPVDLAQLVVRELVTPGDGREAAKRSGINADRFGQLVQLATPRLSPADLAQLVVRGFTPLLDAEDEATLSGVTPDRFRDLVKIAADAPGPGDLAVALRRGVIPEDAGNPDTPSFAGGIREGRLGNKWIPMIKALAVQWPTPADALNALLEGQVSEEQARTLYHRFGGDLDYFTMLFNTRGNAPTPVEALELLNRGIIPERGTGPDSVSYQQAFLEGPWRNKWLDPFLALRTYVTPPRSVVAMVRDGAYTDRQAATALAKSGLSAEDITAYLSEAHQVAATTDKNLTQTAVIDLYQARVIARADAKGLLEALDYSPHNAEYLLELADLRRSIQAVNTAVSRVHTLYTGHKIKRDAAVTVLGQLGVPGDQVSDLLHTWDLEAGANVKQLTEAQIVAAWDKGVISDGEASDELVSVGYTPYDAWVLLSTKNGEPLPHKPPRGPSPVGVIP